MRRGQIIPNTGVRQGSQADALTEAAMDAGIKHGETARVRVRDVRARRVVGMRGRFVFFCNSEVEVLERLVTGDGRPMPRTDMVIENLGKVPDGSFTLEGIITSNGRNVLQVGRIRDRRSLNNKFAGV